MNDELKNQPSTSADSQEAQIIGLIKRMQQQLTFLEQKVDMILNKLNEKPSTQRTFSKPFRSFERPARSDYRDHREHNRDTRERGSYSGQYADREHKDDAKYRGSRKDYRDSRIHTGQGAPFKKKFGHKGKPFFNKRKDH